MHLDPKTLLLLAKLTAADAKRSRKDVDAGEHKIDKTFTIHLEGHLKVSDDLVDVPMPNKIDWTGLFCLALSKLNATTIGAVLRSLEEIDPEELKALKIVAKTELDKLKAKTIGNKFGAVRVGTGAHYRVVRGAM